MNPEKRDDPTRPILDELRKVLKTEYSTEDLSRQLGLLRNFLGKPQASFAALENSDGLKSEREQKANLVIGWVANNRPMFPDVIQGRMNRLAILAGVFTSDDRMKMLDWAGTIRVASEDWALLAGYEKLLRRTLLERSNTEDRHKQRKPGATTFPTPPGSEWNDVIIRFLDGHTVSVRCKDASGAYEYTQMGMDDGRASDRPNLQWELLKTFAEESGKIDWSSPGAGPKRKKQVQLLARHLKKFFDMEDYPFKQLWKGTKKTSDWKCIGWEAKFRIRPELNHEA